MKPKQEIADEIRDSLVNALEEDSIGMTNNPVLPLVGSENVPITEKEEQDVE
ncbi:MAG: hypothetical protein J6Q22_09775 [Prevotella sp.]|nr:hypothetical protein [Prevotella sp.]